MYLYRAVDKEDYTVDFLLTRWRNKYAAHKFLIKAATNNGCPKKIKKSPLCFLFNRRDRVKYADKYEKII
ncbi:MAG: DDE-type integrase/transposase/recombinase [Chitinophagaceae bacterium]|nr:DDE-type integrase/transposase/recombinase [Chitinophagaceae bacterium]